MSITIGGRRKRATWRTGARHAAHGARHLARARVPRGDHHDYDVFVRSSPIGGGGQGREGRGSEKRGKGVRKQRGGLIRRQRGQKKEGGGSKKSYPQ